MQNSHHNQWYRQMPGALLVQQEKQLLNRWLGTLTQAVVVQVGGAVDYQWVNSDKATVLHVTDQPLCCQSSHQCIQADLTQLPICPESVDAVLLPHVLAYSDSPQAILQAAFQILKPGGQIIILGLNKYGLWRLYALLGVQSQFFSQQYFLSGGQIKRYLRQLGMRIVLSQTMEFRPPLSSMQMMERLHFLEYLGQLCLPAVGAATVIIAIKQVVGMNAIPVTKCMENVSWRSEQVRQTTRSIL